MPPTPTPRRSKLAKIIVVTATSLLLAAWLMNTPAGLLGKADAVGYAVCHRISERTFFLGDRPLPLCARCSGMYLGALLGLLYQARSGRQGGTPSRKFLIVLALFLMAFAFDGLNSYVHFWPTLSHLYEPRNFLRLITGTGLGIGMAAMLFPVFNQTIWMQWIPEPALHSWRQLGELLIMAAILILSALSENPLLLYPLALLSSATVLVILTMVYTMIWTMLLKRENKFNTFRSLWSLLLAGFGTALLQIAVMDIGRYIMTGTWDGFFTN